jgi:hypothetical protein
VVARALGRELEPLVTIADQLYDERVGALAP